MFISDLQHAGKFVDQRELNARLEKLVDLVGFVGTTKVDTNFML